MYGGWRESQLPLFERYFMERRIICMQKVSVLVIPSTVVELDEQLRGQCFSVDAVNEKHMNGLHNVAGTCLVFLFHCVQEQLYFTLVLENTYENGIGTMCDNHYVNNQNCLYLKTHFSVNIESQQVFISDDVSTVNFISSTLYYLFPEITEADMEYGNLSIEIIV